MARKLPKRVPGPRDKITGNKSRGDKITGNKSRGDKITGNQISRR